MIKLLLLAVVPFMTQHRNVVPKTEVSTNFYGSVTGVVDKAYIEARVGAGGGGGGCDTNAVDALANSAVVTNALTVATTNRVASLETATGNLSSSVSGLASSKADRPALPVTAGNLAALTADGNLADSGIAKDRVVTIDEGGRADANAFRSSAVLTDYIYNQGAGAPWINVKNGALSPDAPEAKWYYLGTTDDREIAVKGDISATNPTFSNAVLAVQIDTNTVAQIGELKQFFDGLPVGTVGTSIGGIILALLGAAAFLKKKTALLENDGKATDTFATDLLGKQVAKEAVRYAFDSPTSSTTTTGTVETTAVTANSNTVASVTIPAAASGNTPSLAITVPEALGLSDVRDLIVYAVNADTVNDCPIGIVGGTPVPQDGADAKIQKGSRAYICVSKMPTTGEWFIQAVKLTAAA